MYQIAAPLKNIIVVSVTRKDGMSKTIVQTPFRTPIRIPIGDDGEDRDERRPWLSREIAALAGHDRSADHAAHRHDRGGREVDLGHHQNHHEAQGCDEQREDLQEDVPEVGRDSRSPARRTRAPRHRGASAQGRDSPKREARRSACTGRERAPPDAEDKTPPVSAILETLRSPPSGIRTRYLFFSFHT